MLLLCLGLRQGRFIKMSTKVKKKQQKPQRNRTHENDSNNCLFGKTNVDFVPWASSGRLRMSKKEKIEWRL